MNEILVSIHTNWYIDYRLSKAAMSSRNLALKYSIIDKVRVYSVHSAVKNHVDRYDKHNKDSFRMPI